MTVMALLTGWDVTAVAEGAAGATFTSVAVPLAALLEVVLDAPRPDALVAAALLVVMALAALACA